MDPEKIIDGQSYDPPKSEETQSQPEEEHNKPKSSSPGFNKAWKQVENIGQTLGEALQGRGNVVMVRVNDETLGHLDMLVEAELCKSRSEAAALLIGEGIKSNQSLFERVREITDQIAGLRSKLRETVQSDRAASDSTEQNNQGA
jgi:hypothetical protein